MKLLKKITPIFAIVALIFLFKGTVSAQCNLNISITMGNCVPASSTRPVYVVIQNPDDNAKEINVFLDGVLFPWCPADIDDNAPVVFTCWVTPNEFHTIFAESTEDPNCASSNTFFAPACACDIEITASVAGGCNSNLEVPVSVVVTASYPAGSEFNVYIDGSLSPGSPYPYAASSATSITVFVPGTGSNHAILAEDIVNTGCNDQVFIATPLCVPPACSMDVTAAITGGCSGGKVPVAVTATVSNPVGSGFNIFLDGTLVSGSPFNYSAGSSTTVSINVVGNNANHTILAVDSGNSNCLDNAVIATPSCACSLGLTASVAGACNGGNVPVALAVTASNPAGTAFNVYLDGTLVSGSPFPYGSGSSTSISINVPGNNAAHNIQVADATSAACNATASVTTPNCACALGLTATVAGGCNGGNVPVALGVTFSNPPGTAFNVYLDGTLVPGSPFPYGSGSSTSISINVPGNNAAHNIQVADATSAACNANAAVTTPSCACALGLTATVAGGCNGGNVPVALGVTFSNPPGTAFNVYLDGTLVSGSPFPYGSGSSTSISINVPGNNAAHNIQVADATSAACNANASVTTPNCACALGLTATVAGGCNGGNVPVALGVTFSNPLGTAFNVYLDGTLVAGSPFPYGSGSSTSISINVPGNNAAHNIQVADATSAACNANASVTTPNCACALGLTATVAGACNGGNVPVALGVTFSNPPGTAFNVYLDGTLVAGSPFPYGSGSSTSISINVPGNNAAHNIQVVDQTNTACAAVTSVITPSCSCSMSVAAAVAGGCNANQQVPALITVTIANPAGTGFNVFLDGTLVAGSPYSYSSGSSTTIAINLPGDGAVHNISTQDATQSSCSATTTLSTPNCACTISISAAVSGPCNANLQVPVAITITATNPGPSGFNLYLDGALVPGSPFSYSAGSSTVVSIVAPGDGGAHLLQVRDVAQNTCTATTSIITPSCNAPACALSATAVISGSCNANQQVPVTVTVSAVNPAGNGFNVYLDGSLVPGSPFPYGSGSSTSVIILVPGNGITHSIQVKDAANPNCNALTAVTTPICSGGGCSLAISAAITGGCNGLGQAPLMVTVTPTNPAGTGFNILIDGALQPGGPFPYAASSTTIMVTGDGNPHNVLVQDATNSNCAAITAVSFPLCGGPCGIVSLEVGSGGPAVHIVEVRDYTFFPDQLSVQAGDTVRFVWVTTIPHSTTSDITTGPNHWDSGVIGLGSVYDVVIPETGNHPYYCSNHGGPGGLGMTGIITVIDPCIGGNAHLPATFTVQNGSALGYNIFIDGVAQTGNPHVYQNANGVNTITVVVPGNGANHTLTIQDAATAFCAYTVPFTAPVCVNECGITATAVQTLPCNSNQQVGYDLVITPENQGDSGFNVYLDGQLYAGSPFAYASSSATSVSLLISGDNANHLIEVVDVDSISCTASVLIHTPGCSTDPCAIGPVTAAINTPAKHTVLVDDDFFNPASLSIIVGDTVHFVWVGHHAHTVTSDAQVGADAFNSGLLNMGATFDVVLQNAGDHPYYCIPHGSPGGIGMAGILHVETPCADGKLPVLLTFTSQNGSSDGFSVILDGVAVPGSPFNYPASGTSTLTVQTPANGLNHLFTIMDMDDPNCMQQVLVNMPDCSDPCFDFRTDFDAIENEFTLTVAFHAEQASNTTYTWYFGDGTTGSGQDVTHQYAEEGIYTVCMVAINDMGCTDTVCVEINLVSSRCEALFAWDNSGLAVNFQNQSDANVPITHYLWNFGDGVESQDENPNHIFTGLGIYNVCLTITADSCSDTYCQILDLSNPCLLLQGDYTYVATGANLQTIEFQDASMGNPDSWLWGFGDGFTAFQQNPVHTYANSGTYTVCMIAMNSVNGCNAPPACKVIYVNTSGTENAQESGVLTIYPNPADANQAAITVTGIPEAEWGKTASVRLFDVHGRTGMREKIGAQGQMPLVLPANLSAGIYFMEIAIEGKIYRGKIVLQ